MPTYLRFTTGAQKDQPLLLEEGVPLLLGRSRHANVKLDDQRVSRVHCEVELEGKQVMVTDLDSAGGTFVNGNKITEHPLQMGDVVRIGDTQLRLETRAVTGADAPAAKAVAPAKAAAPRTSEQLHELTGKTLSHFEVGPLIGRGQTGLVFRATSFKDDREVALKVFWPQGAKNSPEMRRFVRSIKAMLPLRHPNLVTLYGAGKTGQNCWIAMELIEGENLSQVIDRLGVAGQLNWRDAFGIGYDLAQALEFAHERGVIHRNITPRNVLIRAKDKATKLGDLTLAKALEGTLAEEITKPGEIIGDVRYMSPERTGGDLRVDGRSDIYSLGALLYALLTGKPPYESGSLMETIKKIRTEELERPKRFQMSLPDLFEGAVLKMLAKHPEDRQQTAADLIKDLKRVAKFSGIKV